MISVNINKIINFFFKNISLNQIILKNSFWLVVGRLLGGILRAILVIFSARILGAAEYGSFALAMSFASIFAFLPEGGLTFTLSIEIPKTKDEKEKYSIFKDIFLLSLFFSLISYFLIIILGSIFLKDLTAKIILPILSLMIIFDILRELIYGVYRAELKSELQGIFHFLTNFILFSIGLITILNFPTSFYLAWAYLISITTGFFLSSLFLLNYFKNFKFKIDLRKWLFYFNLSWPIALANALYALLFHIDSFILGWYFPSYVVGIYNSSIKINEFLGVFPSGIALAMLPIFSRYLSEKNNLRKNLEFSIQLIYLIILPIIIGGYLLSEKIINFVFGEEYLTAHYAFKILIPSLFANSLFAIFSQLLIALNKRIKLLIYETLIILINFIGNMILIPYFDFIGAAYMTTLSNFLSLIFSYFIINKYLDFNIFSGLNKPLIASFLMGGLVILFLKFNLLLTIIIGMISYFLLLILLKEEISLKILKRIIR